MDTVYIKTSIKKIIIYYLKLALFGLPFVIYYFWKGFPYSFIGWVLVMYYILILLFFIYEMYFNYKKTLVEINKNGLEILGKYFVAWEEIYDFKIVYRKIKTKNKTLKRYETITKQSIKINEKKFDFSSYYSDFSNLEIVEIIKMYKERMEHAKIEQQR